jgi:hypothetical protein
MAQRPGEGPAIFLSGNRVQVRNAEPAWDSFEPQRDGKPLLGGTSIIRAVLAGPVLALALSRPGERLLVLFRGPDGAVLGECNLYPRGSPFALSADGRRLARRRAPREVVVQDTADFAAPPVVTALAGLHNGLEVSVEAHPFRLHIRVGGHVHTFTVTAGRLVHTRAASHHSPLPAAHADRENTPRYDPARFTANCGVCAGGWTAVTDRLGQVVVYGRWPGPVAAFVVRRETAAAWAAGGAFWGDPALIGGPPTPDADRVIGKALADADEG